MNIELNKIKKILLIKLLYIGDVVLTTPAIRTFKESLPHATISMAVYKNTAPVLEGNPNIAEILSLDSAARKLPAWKRLKKEIEFVREVRNRQFDLIVNLTNNDRGAILSFLSGAQYRIGMSRPKKSLMKNWNKLLFTHLYTIDNTHTHWAARHLEAVRLLGFEPKAGKLEIYLKDLEIKETKELLIKNGWDGNRKLIHIHPTARLKSKCWRAEGVADVINYVIHAGYDVALTSGKDRFEMDIIEKILSLTKYKPINLAGKTSLREIASISSLSTLFIGVDSAPIHIAAAVDTPVIALFGPMPVELWRPWGNGHTVLIKYMDCLPCGLDGCNGSGKSECLDSLSSYVVIEKIKEILENNKQRYMPSTIYYIN